MNSIRIHNRIVISITSEDGQRDYYDYMNIWSSCFLNSNKRIVPKIDEAREYLTLKQERPSLFGDLTARKRYNKLQEYNNRYDWRPKKFNVDKSVGLMSPSGEVLLNPDFTDVFTQFDAINLNQDFIPVFNGDRWALVQLSEPTSMMTEFTYRRIIPERWERRMYFVQDNYTLKWGALIATHPIINERYHSFDDTIIVLDQLMPPIADEIYEDELMTDCSPTLFFMTRVKDKIGILTNFGYSDIIYDTYECDSEKMTFRLIRNDQKRAKRVDFYYPNGRNRSKKNHPV